MIMKNNIVKQLLCLICFVCLSQVLLAESLYVRVVNNHGVVHDADVVVDGPGNIITTKELKPRGFMGLRGGAAYDIHVYYKGKHIKETFMIPIGSSLTVEINVDNYPFTGLLSIPKVIAYSPIQNSYGDVCMILGVIPNRQRLIV